MLSEVCGSRTIPKAASWARTSSERIDVPTVLSRLVRLDVESLCFRKKQRVKIAAIRSIERGALLSLKKRNPFRVKYTLHCQTMFT